MNYKQKYIKYKEKYKNLKRMQSYDGYYLLHGTDLPHLKKILKTGYIFSGKYLPDEDIRLGGWEKLPYVYCNIYFDDIKNLPFSHGYSLIIDPIIIKEKGIIFNKGWKVHPTEDSIQIKPNDPDYDNKINLIKELVENPSHLPENIKNIMPGFMHHEILIKDHIDLHKYLIGVIIPGMEGFDDDIRQILNENGYKDIKIFTSSNLPDTKDLFT